VVAAATFVTSLGHLVASPAQQGWTFDVVVGNANDQTDQVARDAPLLDRNHYVAGYAAIASPPETPVIDGHNINVVGVEQREGGMQPPIVQGRFAVASDEIVLGRASLHAIHKHIGDTVVVTAGQHAMTMRITGVALGLSAGSVFNGRLDEGAIVRLDALKRLEPDAFVTLFFVRFAPGVDYHAALASLRRDFGRDTLLHVTAQDVQNLVRVDALPRLVAVLLVAIALATLANTLFVTVRRQRRTIATLKAIGFERSQIAGTVFSQTWALTIVGVAIGLPAGAVIGRSTWRYIASQIGSVEPAAIPAAVIGLAVAAAALSTTLVAMFPALRAARLRPGAALRDE
jgi:putative ABC transport system permease protein